MVGHHTEPRPWVGPIWMAYSPTTEEAWRIEPSLCGEGLPASPSGARGSGARWGLRAWPSARDAPTRALDRSCQLLRVIRGGAGTRRGISRSAMLLPRFRVPAVVELFLFVRDSVRYRLCMDRSWSAVTRERPQVQ